MEATYTDTEANSFTFDIPLTAGNEEEASFKLRNTSPNEVHRIAITGLDRKGTTAVCGRLIHVIHGFHSISFPLHDLRGRPLHPDQHLDNMDLAAGNQTPYSLIVLEWNMHPGGGGPSRRFRDVRIDLVFAATKGRLGVPKNGDLSAWDPVPKRIAPPVGPPLLSYFTPVKALKARNWSAGPTIGYDGIASIDATYGGERKLEVKYMDSCSIAGAIRYDERSSGEPNAVRFTFVENKAAETGVPPTVRTAVLLERRDWDTDGWFSMTVKVTSHVHWLQDGKEKLRSAVGFKPRDDPVNFDPADSYVVQDGERVKRKDARIRGVDWRRLGEVDLNRFLLDQDRGLGSEDEDSEASDASIYEDAQESP